MHNRLVICCIGLDESVRMAIFDVNEKREQPTNEPAWRFGRSGDWVLESSFIISWYSMSTTDSGV